MYLTKYLLTHDIDDDKFLTLNTLSGAIDVVDMEYKRFFDHPELISADIPIYKSLIERGYMYESEAAEQEKLKSLYAHFNSVDRPVMFVICPTYACNLRCVYCFEGDLTTEQQRVLTTDEVDSIFRAIKKLSTKEASIQLFGGEPFLLSNRKIVSYIIDQAARLDYTISAVTNGVNLLDFLPLLLKYKKNLVDFQITLDGPAEVHDIRRPRAGGQGTFNDIVKSIDAALESGLKIRLRVNVDRENIGYLKEMSELIKDRGWDKFENFVAMLSPVDNHTGAELSNKLSENETAKLWFKMKEEHQELEVFRPDLFRNLDYIITTIKRKKVSYPRFQYCESNNLTCYTFGTDGKVYLCAEAIGNQSSAVGVFHPDLMLDESLVNQWNGRSIMTLDKCRDCPIATFCGGGCAYAALCINGAIGDPYCNNAIDTVHTYLDSISQEVLDL